MLVQNGATVVKIAATNGHTEIVEELLKLGVDINQRDKVDTTVCT